MKRSLIHTAVAIVSAIGLAVATPGAQTPAAGAAQSGENQAAEKGRDTSGDAVARLGQAAELVAYAREHESPVAMVTAVQMLRGVRAQEGGDRVGAEATQPVAKGDAQKEEPKRAESEPTLDPATLLQEARSWAEGDAPMLALIDAELARPAAAPGATLGPQVPGGVIRMVRRIPARTIVHWNITFRGGEIAHVNVVGDGDTDLDVYVYDQNGNLIARDMRFGDRVGVSWTPRWTGPFRIEVHNLGRIWNGALIIMS
jgi:hypothetical protein